MKTANNIERQESRKKDEKRTVSRAENSTLSASGRKGGVPGAPQLRPYCWQPGQSGNPGGRPRIDLSAEMCRAQFENDGPAIYAAINKSLRKGSPYALQVVSDRAYGKMKETHQVDVGRYGEREATEEELLRHIAELDDQCGLTELRNENAELKQHNAELGDRVAELERKIDALLNPSTVHAAPAALKPM